MAFSKELLDQLLAGCERPEDILGPDGLFAQLKTALAERALGAELSHHLAHEAAEPDLERRRNHRNGTSGKTVLTETGAMRVAIPRDRAGTFEPQLIPKHQRRLEGFDAKVLSLYGRGMTVREVQEHLTELYGVEVSPDLISTVTDVRRCREQLPWALPASVTLPAGHPRHRFYQRAPCSPASRVLEFPNRPHGRSPYGWPGPLPLPCGTLRFVQTSFGGFIVRPIANTNCTFAAFSLARASGPGAKPSYSTGYWLTVRSPQTTRSLSRRSTA